MSLFDVAARAKEMKKKGDDHRRPRHQGCDRYAADVSPTGCHIAEVEIDPATGFSRHGVTIRRWTTAGNILDTPSWPVMVARLGRHGFGQAMNGADRLMMTAASCVSASFMDYACRVPRTCRCSRTRFTSCRRPPILSASRARGEAGTTAAIAAIMNAFFRRDSRIGRHKIQMAVDTREGVEGVSGDWPG